MIMVVLSQELRPESCIRESIARRVEAMDDADVLDVLELIYCVKEGCEVPSGCSAPKVPDSA